jgi:hypothetical protein
MIINERLIYLQMQKTGCSHIERVLASHVDARPHGPKHGRLHVDPGKRVVLGSVRNPWAWYVSLWAYGCGPAGNFRASLTRPAERGWRRGSQYLRLAPRRVLRGLRPEAPQLRREPDMWRRLYGDTGDVHRFRAWLRAVLIPPGRDQLPEGYPDSGLSRFAGFMTYRFVRLNSRVADWDRRHRRIRDLPALRDFWDESRAIGSCVRTEQLERDLAAALTKAGYDIDPDGITAKARANASSHRPWEDYYDQETASLVASRDAFIIETFGYDPP